MGAAVITPYQIGGVPTLVPLTAKDAPKPKYRVVSPYRILAAGRTWTVPQGFMYDGASIPTLMGALWVLTYSPFHPWVMPAACVHDYFCDNKPSDFNSVQAAELFRVMLLWAGVSEFKARAMWRAVRVGGPRW